MYYFIASFLLTLIFCLGYAYGKRMALHLLGLELARMNQCPLCLSRVDYTDFKLDSTRGKSARQYARRVVYGRPEWLDGKDQPL